MSSDKDIDKTDGNDNDDEKKQENHLIPIDDIMSADADSGTFSQDSIDAVSTNTYQVGDRVIIETESTGSIRFIGLNDTNILFYGVELDVSMPEAGDGHYKNIKYFESKPQHALFVETSQMERLSFNYLNKEDEEYVASFLNDMLSIQDCDELKIDDVIDHWDNVNASFFDGTIIDKKGSNLKIHYKNAPDEYDVWSDYKKELYRFAKHKSITRHKLSRLLKHEYHKYIKLHQDLPIIYRNLRICLACIKTRIVPKRTAESRGALVEYLCELKTKLFNEFLFIKLKQRIAFDHEIVYAQILKDFHKMYCSVVDSLTLQNDQHHLDVSKDVARSDSNDSNDLSEYNKTTIKQIKLKWYTINEEGKTSMECDDDETCDCYGCISMKRVEYLLELFNTYFINKHKEDFEENRIRSSINSNSSSDGDELDFVSIFNCLSYSIIDAINDFNHIKSHHIPDLAKSEYIISKCKHDICILNKRIVENNRDALDEEINGYHYFGFKLSEEINIIKFWIKLHVFISHRQCLIKYNPNEVKAVPINEESSKFVTNVTEFAETEEKEEQKCEIEDKNDNNNKKRMSKFEFGQQFFYTKYFKKEKDRYYIPSPHFPNLKEELLHNNIYPLRINIFHSQLLQAQKLILSFNGKRMKALNKGINNIQYEVAVDSPISMSHLLCILIYTNLTKLQCEFKKMGCRKTSKNDTMDDIANRNKQIGNWYTLFMETVLIYGVFTTKKNVFYHGLSIKLLFASFNPIFKCPISTTVEFHVAHRFATDGGIILELKSIATSGDSYLDVSWISNYPEESERLFAFARNLTINDIRFWMFASPRNKGIQFKHSHYIHLCALRLFDNIFQSNSPYKKSILSEKSQQILIKYISNYCEIIISKHLFMDQLYNFNKNKKLLDVTRFIHAAEYDSDAVWYDLGYSEGNNSHILQYLRKDDKQCKVFHEFIQYQQEICDIPQYLMNLFCFMVNNLMQQNEDIFIIKSEYDNKLQKELKDELLSLKLPKKRIKYIKEFQWKIEGNKFTELQTLETNDYISGPDFVFNDGQIIIIPQIKRSAIEWINNCEIGIRMKENTSSVASVKVSWSFLIEETNYSMKEHYATLKFREYNGYKSFSNDRLNTLASLTLTFFVRLY